MENGIIRRIKFKGGNCMRQCKIVCNKCGREIENEDVLSIEKRWGYFSNKDNDVHKFDLCENCYDEFVSTFQIPVEIE